MEEIFVIYYYEETFSSCLCCKITFQLSLIMLKISPLSPYGLIVQEALANAIWIEKEIR